MVSPLDPLSQVLGAKTKNLAGRSTATAGSHQGFVIQCPVVQQTPPALRLKAMRLVASTCTLLARVDAFGQDPLGRAGAGGIGVTGLNLQGSVPTQHSSSLIRFINHNPWFDPASDVGV